MNPKQKPKEGLRLGNLNVYSVRAFSTLFYFVGYFIAFSNFVNQSINVYEYIFTTFIRCNEAVSFSIVEEFYSTVVHYLKFI